MNEPRGTKTATEFTPGEASSVDEAEAPPNQEGEGDEGPSDPGGFTYVLRHFDGDLGNVRPPVRWNALGTKGWLVESLKEATSDLTGLL